MIPCKICGKEARWHCVYCGEIFYCSDHLCHHFSSEDVAEAREERNRRPAITETFDLRKEEIQNKESGESSNRYAFSTMDERARKLKEEEARNTTIRWIAAIAVIIFLIWLLASHSGNPGCQVQGDGTIECN